MPRASAIARRLACLAALPLAGCAAPAPDTAAPPPPSFAALDRDADGVVDRAEWDRYGARVFARLDGDGDGILSAEEMARAHAALDLDGDGFISEDEAIVGGLDRDGDGRISAEEWDAIRAIVGLDTDGDGGVSLREVEASRNSIFDSLAGASDPAVQRVEGVGTRGWTAFRF